MRVKNFNQIETFRDLAAVKSVSETVLVKIAAHCNHRNRAICNNVVAHQLSHYLIFSFSQSNLIFHKTSISLGALRTLA